MAAKPRRTPPTTRRKTAATVTVPRDLVDQTVQLVLDHFPAGQVFPLLERWKKAIPDIYRPRLAQPGPPPEQ